MKKSAINCVATEDSFESEKFRQNDVIVDLFIVVKLSVMSAKKKLNASIVNNLVLNKNFIIKCWPNFLSLA